MRLPHFTTTLPQATIDALRAMADKRGLSVGQLIAQLTKAEERRAAKRK